MLLNRGPEHPGQGRPGAVGGPVGGGAAAAADAVRRLGQGGPFVVRVEDPRPGSQGLLPGKLGFFRESVLGAKIQVSPRPDAADGLAEALLQRDRRLRPLEEDRLRPRHRPLRPAPLR